MKNGLKIHWLKQVYFQRISLIFLLGVILIPCAACSSNPGKYKTTTTEDYTILLPVSWSVLHGSENSAAPSLQFSNSKQQIGRFQVLPYDKEYPVNSLFGNHVSRILFTKDLSGTKIPVKQSLLERNWNENKQSYISYELHVYFIPANKITKYDHEVAYDFYLDTGKIKESQHPELLNLNEKQAEEHIWQITDLSQDALDKIVDSFRLKI